MNKEFRRSISKNRWSETEMFLDYLRDKDCFQSMGGRPCANPYWYGTTMDFEKTQKFTEELINNHTIKRSRLENILTNCENNLMSPIVRLVGIYLKRILNFSK